MPQTSVQTYLNRAVAGVCFTDVVMSTSNINAGGQATQVQTITVAAGAANDTILASINGAASAAVTFDTDNATTALALANAIRQSPNYGRVIVDVAGAVITVTARNPGVANAVTLATTVTGAITGTVAQTVAAADPTAIPFGSGVFYDYSVPTDSIGDRPAVRVPQAGDTIQNFAGIARFRHTVENQEILAQYELSGDEDGAIPPNDDVDTLKDGGIYVRVEGAINPANAAQVRLVAATDGTPAGRFSTAGSEGAGGAVLDVSSVISLKTLDGNDGYAALYIKHK